MQYLGEKEKAGTVIISMRCKFVLSILRILEWEDEFNNEAVVEANQDDEEGKLHSNLNQLNSGIYRICE
jgi:hypothetical protein